MMKMKLGLKEFLLFKKYIFILEKMEVFYPASQVGKRLDRAKKDTGELQTC